MGIDFRGLTTSQDEADRQIREFITTPQGTLEIYEPTVSDISDIIEIQRVKQEDLGENVEEMEFDGTEVIKKIFPLITNIDLSDLSDEEIEDVIANPSIHLLTAQQVVAQIMLEANKLYAQRVMTEITEAESTLAQAELINSIPAIIIGNARREGRMAELTDNVQKAESELAESIKASMEESTSDDNQEVTESNHSVSLSSESEDSVWTPLSEKEDA